MDDWEPEIPGQFDTPLRIRRKRAAEEAGFSSNDSNLEVPAPVVRLQPIVLEHRFVAPIVHIFATTFRIIHQLFSASAYGANATRSSMRAATRLRPVVEIRRLTADGYESVKRRVAGLGRKRPVALTSQQIIRGGHQAARLNPPRKLPRRVASPRIAPPRETPHLQTPPPLATSLQQLPPPRVLAPQPPIDREALAARILARFTPRPLPGVHVPLDMEQMPITHTEPVSASVTENLAVRKPVLVDPAAQKPAISIPSKFSTSKKARRSLFPLKNNLSYHKSQESGDTAKYPRTRRSQCLSSATEAQETRTHGAIVSETPKRVRIALDPSNGLPHQTSVSFYRDSRVGDWAPSSPWSEEQALGAMSDLDGNLASLMTQEPWSLPPSTPIANHAITYPRSIAPGEDPSYFLEPNRIFSPQDIDSAIRTSLLETSSHSSFSPEYQKLGYESLGYESPAYRSLAAESPALQTPVTAQIKAGPYLRMKELWKGSIRQIFFTTSPEPSPYHIVQQTVQEAVDTSVEMLDASPPPTESPNCSSSMDPLSILKLSPIGRGTGHSTAVEAIDFGPVAEADNPSTIIEPANDRAFNSGSDSAGNTSDSEPADVESGHSPTEQSTNSPKTRKSPSAQQKEESGDIFLELAMSELEMSESMKTKLSRKQKERKAAEAAKKAAEEAAAVKAKAEVEEAERKTRSNRRMPKQKLVQPLSKEWDAKIDEALRKGDHIPLATTITGTELRRRDFMTVLGERQWLNDEIINAYLEWIVEYANEKAGKNGRNAIPKAIAHNSFFYKNIATKGPNSVSRWMKRKKAEGKKLLEVETVLIPVNNASHWTIIVVSPKQRTIEYLDSFAGPSKVFINHTKAWLAVELGKDWHEDEWSVLDTQSTEQRNGYDCGVFTITNAECVIGGIVTNSYDFQDMTAQRRRIAGVLLNRGFGGEFIPAEEL